MLHFLFVSESRLAECPFLVRYFDEISDCTFPLEIWNFKDKFVSNNRQRNKHYLQKRKLLFGPFCHTIGFVFLKKYHNLIFSITLCLILRFDFWVKKVSMFSVNVLFFFLRIQWMYLFLLKKGECICLKDV